MITANRVRERRLTRNWSQADLATRAGISRAAVSAIEMNRLIPSVAAALALASALDCSVEDLFGKSQPMSETTGGWAWPGSSRRFWCGSIQGRLLFYPAEDTPLGMIPHDGVGTVDLSPTIQRRAAETLVMATCDPAVAVLAKVYERQSGFRLLAFCRSSRQALELLRDGLVHVAGVHLSTADSSDGNAEHVRNTVAQPTQLLRIAEWQDGIAVGSGVAGGTVRSLLRNRITWIGREPGSGARQCLDELLENRPAPRRIARDHRGVAEAIRCGWGDAGICLQITAEDAGLRFLPLRMETYDLCYLQSSEDDPRVQALIRTVRSAEYQQLLGELPGYAPRQSGSQISVSR